MELRQQNLNLAESLRDEAMNCEKLRQENAILRNALEQHTLDFELPNAAQVKQFEFFFFF